MNDNLALLFCQLCHRKGMRKNFCNCKNSSTFSPSYFKTRVGTCLSSNCINNCCFPAFLRKLYPKGRFSGVPEFCAAVKKIPFVKSLPPPSSLISFALFNKESCNFRNDNASRVDKFWSNVTKHTYCKCPMKSC